MAQKKIGTYLIEEKACDPATIKQVLRIQDELASQGQYKPLGQVMLEDGALSPEALARVLNRQRVDVLSIAELFQSLPDTLVSELAEIAEDRAFPAQQNLFRQADSGSTYWLLIAGQVRVYRQTNDGPEVSLATLHPGDGFGEMALLTGEPRSASVDTLTPCRFLVIAKSNFDTVVGANPILSMAFTRILADWLTRGNADLAKASATERAYQRFVSEHQAGPQLKVVGKSPLIRKLKAGIAEAARHSRPVLISGPAGTEKRSVAWQIHRDGLGPDNPFLVVDARTATLGGQDPTAARGANSLQLELAQASTLFGHEQGSLPFATNSRLGLLMVGNNGTVLIENSEDLCPTIQAKLAASIKQGSFRPLGNDREIQSNARLIFANGADPADLQAGPLAVDQELTIPPLKRRKKDMRAIVNSLVEHYGTLNGHPATGLADEAYQDIMAYHWPGNMEELTAVIRRAVALAHGRPLSSSDILIGPAAPVPTKLSFNLLKIPPLKALFLSPRFPAIFQIATGLFFTLIFCLGLWGPQDPKANVSLVLTWGIWEPLLILSTLATARLWCGICPVGGLCTLANRVGLNRRVPVFIRRYGPYLAGLGIGLIIWAEVASHMTASPIATALLITAITGPALLIALLFERRVWCRYLCPLGKMVGIFSSASFIELRANYSICNNDCTSHSCYVGDPEQVAGCPVFEGPFSLHNNQDCILCGNCIKNCQHQSPRLNLRLPGRELWPKVRPDRILDFTIPLIMGAQFFRGLTETELFRWLSETGGLTLLGALAGISLLVSLGIRASRRALAGPERTTKAQLSSALLFLVLGNEIAFQAGRLLSRAGQLLPVLGNQLSRDWTAYGFTYSLWSIKTLQVIILLLGIMAGLAVLKRVISPTDQNGTLPVLWRWPVLVPGALYIGLTIARL